MQRFANLKFLLALSLVLRLAFLLLAGVNAPLVGDELAFQQIAVNVAAGRGFVQNNNPFFPGQVLYAWQAPLYPLSLSVLYFFLRPDPIFGKLFGLLIGVATVFLTFDLAQRIFSPPIREAKLSLPHLAISSSSSPPVEKGNPNPPSLGNGTSGRIPWLAGLVVAVYPGFLTSAHLLLSETLFTFLLVFAFDLIAATVEFIPPPFRPRESASVSASPSTTDWNSEDSSAKQEDPSLPLLAKRGRGGGLLVVAAGALWGAATLTRGITLYFALPLALWFAIDWATSKHVDLGAILFKKRSFPAEFNAKMPIVFVVAMLCVMAPWAIRNFTVFNQFVLLETKGGVNFWLGNSPFTPGDFIRNVWKTGVREPMLAALPADEIARDRSGYSLGESFVAREPFTFVARMPVKFADFWGFERNLVDAAEATRNGKTGGWNSLAKISADLVSDSAYVLLVLFAVAGLVFVREDRWKLLIGGFIVYFVFVHMIVFGDGRFHLPIVPLLALYAAWFLVNVAEGLRWRSARAVTALALMLVFAGVWAHEIGAAWVELHGGL